MRCRSPLVITAVVAAAAFSLLAAACSGGGSARGVASLATTTTTPAAGAVTAGSSAPGGELAQYASCMRSHGVLNFPDEASFGSPAGIRTAKGEINQISESQAAAPRFQTAQRVCAKYAPQSQPPAHVSPQQMQKLLAVSRCMRAHGVPNFPDPNPITGELSPAGIDTNSPQVLAALQACRSLGQAAGLGAPNTGP
jgi:hypothetical protein